MRARKLSTVFECNDPSVWNLMLEGNSSASAYHLWEYSEALCQTYPYKRHYLICSSNDDILGALPLIHIRSRLFGNRLISLPFCEYGGPLFKSVLAQGKVSEVWNSLLTAGNSLGSKLGVDYVELRHPSLDESLLAKSDFVNIQSYVTFRIDLTKEKSALWNSVERKTKNAVRKAEKSRVEISEVKDSNLLREYFGLYLKTQKRLGSPPHSAKLFLHLFSSFSENKKMKMLLATFNGKAIAGITVFLQGKTVFWWNNVSDAEHRSLNPTNLLLWHTIQWAAENGYESMDLGRTRKPSTIYDFKSGWGGKEEPLKDYAHFTDGSKKSLPDPSQRRYQFLSSMWDLLPIAVTRRIGPRIISGIGL